MLVRTLPYINNFFHNSNWWNGSRVVSSVNGTCRNVYRNLLTKNFKIGILNFPVLQSLFELCLEDEYLLIASSSL